MDLPEEERLCTCGCKMHIIDLETGHILWIQNGKKKQVVYDFIEHVGMEWMDGIEAVACDMNSGFEEAYEAKYNALLKENKLLFTFDLIKEKLAAAWLWLS